MSAVRDLATGEVVLSAVPGSELRFPVGKVYVPEEADRASKPATYASGVISYTGIPVNNETIEVAGITYTFKSALTGADNEVLIGTSAATAAALIVQIEKDKLVDCVEAPAGTITVTSAIPGTAGNAYTLVDGATNYTVSGATLTGGAEKLEDHAVRSTRVRVALADLNAGFEIVAAPGAGRLLRLVDVAAIAIGGAVGATTTVDVKGTQSTSVVKLASFAQASLTQNTLLRTYTVLAAGASFVACDANKGLSVGVTGPAATTATHVDFLVQYAIERA